MEECVQLSIQSLPSGLLHGIFGYLCPRDLCAVSATCKDWRRLNQDAAANQAWKAFYADRWQPTEPTAEHEHDKEGHSLTWQNHYGRKMRIQKVFGGRARQDSFFGHKGGIKCLGLLPGHNLMATGSLDRTVKLWDLNAGMQIATSRFQPCGVRALALDQEMLVCSASKRGGLRVWRGDGAAGPKLFDLNVSREISGHTGPVTSVALNDKCLYSGSWDYTVRIWSRSRLKCLSVIPCSDWVWGVCPRGKNLLVAAGRHACTFDLEIGRPLRRFDSGSERNVLHSPRVEGTRDGKLLFVGNAEGDLLAYDLRSSSQAAANTLWQHGALVQSIAFDDPWMAVAMDDGATLLLNADAAMRGRQPGPGPGGRAVPRGGCGAVRRQFPGAGAGPAYCVDIADQWLACGSDASMVRAWDFSGAEEVQQRLDALRLQREAQRVQRRERGGRHAGRRALPRFPPQLGSSDDEHADVDMDAHGGNPMEIDKADQSSSSQGGPELLNGLEFGSTVAHVHQHGRCVAIPGALDQEQHPCGPSWRDEQWRASDLQASWREHSGTADESSMSRSLPARLGGQRAGSGSAGGGRQIRPLPPPLVRASGCCAEAEAARISRMTSWDIQRPRRSSHEGIKAAG